MKPPRSVQRVRIRQVRDGRVRFSVNRVCRPRDVHEAIRPYYLGADREILSVLCLDSQNQPTSFNVVAIGDLNTARARPVEIVKPAILSNALSIILIHNHPSGLLEPSVEDIEFTHAVQRACDLVGISLADHLIVTDRAFVSLRERGLM